MKTGQGSGLFVGIEDLESRAYLAAAGVTLDPLFGNQGRAVTPILSDNQDAANAVALQRDGRVVVAGYTQAQRDGAAFNGLLVARFNADGTPDSTFGADGSGQVVLPIDVTPNDLARNGLTVQRDGRIVVVAETYHGILFARLNPDGAPDPTFGPAHDGRVEVPVEGVWREFGPLIVRPDGRLLAGGLREVGASKTVPANADFALVQVNADGTPDPTFGRGGVAVLGTRRQDDVVGALGLAPDGSVLIAGRSAGAFAVARVTPSGRLDPTFGGAGTGIVDVGFGNVSIAEGATGVAVLPDGRIVVSGSAGGDLALARLTASGAVDPTFGPAGTGGRVTRDLGSPNDAGAALVVGRDSRLTILGTIGRYDTDARFAAARFDADGNVDPTFGTDGVSAINPGLGEDRAAGAAAYKDGRLVLAGFSRAAGSGIALDAAVVRLTASGAVDTSFAGGGTARLNRRGPSYADIGQAVRLPDGKFLLAGTTEERGWTYTLYVRRSNPDGTPDVTFGAAGVAFTGVNNATAVSAAVGPGGKISLAVQVNEGDLMAPKPRLYLVRLNADGSKDVTFGDGGVVRSEAALANVRAVAVDAAGRMVVTGASFPDASWYVARFTAAGAPDTSFGTAGTVRTGFAGYTGVDPATVAIGPDGRIVVTGSATRGASSAPEGVFAAARYTAQGLLDGSFGPGGRVTVGFAAPGQTARDHATAALLLPDGSLVLAGTSTVDLDARVAVARLLADGRLDPSFGDGGRTLVNPNRDLPAEQTIADDSLSALTLAPDGSFVGAGHTALRKSDGSYVDTPFLVRITAAGGADTALGPGGVAPLGPDQPPVARGGVSVLPTGRIVTVGRAEADALVFSRYDAPAPGISVAVAGDDVVITGTAATDTLRLVAGPSGAPQLADGTPLPTTSASGGPIRRIVIRGLGGDDLIDAVVLGPSLPLFADGGDGNDTVIAGSGNDVLYGGAGDDSLVGGAGHDTLFGHLGADTLHGGDGNDYLNGGPDADQVFGDAGNDQVFAVDSARDTIDGGAGFDRVKSDDDDLLSATEGLLA